MTTQADIEPRSKGSATATTGTPEISLVIPLHDESEGVDTLFEGMLPVLRSVTARFEIVAVNDGSHDAILHELLR